MTPAVFVKHYGDPARGAAAHTHLRWLHQLDSGVRLPQVHRATATCLVLEHLHGRPPVPSDLPDLAATLGLLHGTAYTRELHAAHLDQPFRSRCGLTVPAFHAARQAVLTQLGVNTTGLPAALYKDANLRNFVITNAGPAVVDFDDLTLAPFGYDLAKLVVSTAMTFGVLNRDHLDAALAAYISRVEATGGPATSCTPGQLADYAEIHHLLTARYLHRNGYRHPWPAVRPWPQPAPHRDRLKEPPS